MSAILDIQTLSGNGVLDTQTRILSGATPSGGGGATGMGIVAGSGALLLEDLGSGGAVIGRAIVAGAGTLTPPVVSPEPAAGNITGAFVVAGTGTLTPFAITGFGAITGGANVTGTGNRANLNWVPEDPRDDTWSEL